MKASAITGIVFLIVAVLLVADARGQAKVLLTPDKAVTDPNTKLIRVEFTIEGATLAPMNYFVDLKVNGTPVDAKKFNEGQKGQGKEGWVVGPLDLKPGQHDVEITVKDKDNNLVMGKAKLDFKPGMLKM